MKILDPIGNNAELTLKTILSSADDFPGFYRYSRAPRIIRAKQLNLEHIADVLMQDKYYTREEWLSETKEVYESLESRDLMHSDVGMIQFMRDTYFDWLLNADTYRLLCLEVDNHDEIIQMGQIYFFMGSLIQIKEQVTHIGLDEFTGKSTYRFDYDGEELLAWLNDVYSSKSNVLFSPAREIGELRFNEKDEAKLVIREEAYYECLMFNKPTVFGSNYDRNHHLPIRFAKDIIITNPL